MDSPSTTPSSKFVNRRRLVRRIGLSLAVLLIAAGLAVLANTAWQLWGTGIATAHAQHRLGNQFNANIAAAKAAASSPDPAAVTATRPTAIQSAALPLGSVVAHLVIPKIGVNNYVVEGVGSAQLAEGPGHYPGTAAIGGKGNVGIAGHRTTHGAPFYDLNELKAGDLIYLTNLSGQTFTYRVATQFVVSPDDGAVLDPTTTPSLTLTTCNPRYSAAQRLIVRANLLP
jgi:sortase A